MPAANTIQARTWIFNDSPSPFATSSSRYGESKPAALSGASTSAASPSGETRPEYIKLLSDLSILTRSFGIHLSHASQSDAAALTFCIECADRVLDATSDSTSRRELAERIVGMLLGNFEDRANLHPELARRLTWLETTARAYGVHSQVCEIVAQLLRNAECMRSTRHISEFANCAVLEGRLMVELLLLLIGQWTTGEFDQFMRRLAAPANLIDKLRDARRDFRRGEIAIKPTAIFRSFLSWQMSWRILRLAPFCFCNWRLALWGLRALCTEVNTRL